MKILLTGATGYIGQRLLPLLVQMGHQVYCCVRDAKRFNLGKSIQQHVEVLQLDLLEKESLNVIPEEIDCAFYLVHSMSGSKDYSELELNCAENFREALASTNVQQVIYLSGIVNESELSEHLSSRLAVENELKKGDYHFSCLRAGIIIGSGSASFEIIRDLVEKLPIMIAPKWLNTRCQPVAIANVLDFLMAIMLNPIAYDKSFDIGGTDVLSYKEMLKGYAKVRGLKRSIFTVPIMTPRLSSYWLYYVTSTSYMLASALVNSMKVEVVCQENSLAEDLGIELLDYQTALERALSKISRNEIQSSWKDAFVSGQLNINIDDFIHVPESGCFKDTQKREIQDKQACMDKIWSIGGKNGWYYGNWLWKLRGYLDKFWGGVGLRRGRTNSTELKAGDSLDFWRVLYANKETGHLLLFAEMKLPGEAWLEFKIEENTLIQTATFRPKGVWGRLYWYSVAPFHVLIFPGMIRKLAKAKSEE